MKSDLVLTPSFFWRNFQKLLFVGVHVSFYKQNLVPGLKGLFKPNLSISTCSWDCDYKTYFQEFTCNPALEIFYWAILNGPQIWKKGSIVWSCIFNCSSVSEQVTVD